MSIKLLEVAYNCRDDWPTIAEMGGLDSPKYTIERNKKLIKYINENNIDMINSSYTNVIDILDILFKAIETMK